MPDKGLASSSALLIPSFNQGWEHRPALRSRMALPLARLANGAQRRSWAAWSPPSAATGKTRSLCLALG